MTNLATAFGKNFNPNMIRVRSFELGGHTFRVKVPLASEMELNAEELKKDDPELIEKYYKQIADPLIANKETIAEEGKIEFTEDDVLVEGRSLREAAQNKAKTEQRITSMFKLLVPEEKDFDMNSITYPMIEELFPIGIQMDLMEKISEVISPNYQTTRGK